MTTMPFAETMLCRLTTEIWTTVLGLDLRPVPDLPVTSADDCLTGCIRFSGAWEGAVTLGCPTPLARSATARMLGLEVADLSLEDVRDAVGELANILGGNVKALLPGPCEISLPAVTEGGGCRHPVPGTHPLSEIAFECQGHPIAVSLLRGDVRPSLPPARDSNCSRRL